MVFLLLCLVLRVVGSLAALPELYLSRKSRSNSEPFDTNFLYKHYDDAQSYSPYTYNDGDTSDLYFHSDNQPSHYLSAFPIVDTNSIFTEYPTKHAHHATGDLKAKYMDQRILSKVQSYPPYEYEIHNQPSDAYMSDKYEHNRHVNSEHIRKLSPHYKMPYYYHNPHEYEQMKIDTEIEKAKDKRYAVDAARIIPIHEDLSGDIPNSYEQVITTPEFYYNKETNTDNPLKGNEPFFSFTLNNHFNDNSYDDQMSLKGLHWGKDFDDQSVVKDIDESPKFIYSRSIPGRVKNYGGSDYYHTIGKDAFDKHSVAKEKIQDNNKNEHGNTKEENDVSQYANKGKKELRFKDFSDAFANKFGLEDQKKSSKYIIKKNQDKGENRKGFRRVYHKDEYQEDNEFYDNNNSSAAAIDSGNSHAHIGGSEGLLKSHASAKQSDQAKAYNILGDKHMNKHENNYKKHLENNDFNGHSNLRLDNN